MSPPKKFSKMSYSSEPILQAFNNKRFSDCEVHVEKKVFKVNKLFLCTYSDIFNSYFLHDTKENQTGVIKIEEAKPEIVEAMLKFMYSKEVENLGEITKDLYILADRYNVQDLMSKCLSYLYSHISLSNIFDCFSLATSYDLPELKDKAFSFTVENINKVMEMAEWAEFSLQHYNLVQEIMKRLGEENSKLRKGPERTSSTAPLPISISSDSSDDEPPPRPHPRVMAQENEQQPRLNVVFNANEGFSFRRN